MKNIFISIFILSFFPGFSQTSHRDPSIDVQDYSFEINLNDHDDTIKAISTIHFKLLKEIGNLTFDLSSIRPDGKGMKVLNVSENKQALSFTHANDQIRISFKGKASFGEEKTIQIDYKGIPEDGLVIDTNKYGHRTFFADNWPDRAHHWLACVDHPSDKASVDFIVTAPDHYQVVSNGIQVEETNLDQNRKLTHWQEKVALPMKIMAIGVADFAVNYAGDVNNIPIYSWVYPEDRAKGFYDFGIAAEILPFYIERVGPYPYKKLANVQSKTIFGGMENANTIFYSENSITGKRDFEKTIAHEIAHQWFGDMVTEAEWAHVWLSESFATYMALLYSENKYGQVRLKKELSENRDKVIAFAKKKLAPVIDTTVTHYMELLNPNSYEKGGWILHMLRRQIGDSAFWKGIRSYYAKFAGTNAVTDDFRKIMEEASGRDLKIFFRQWLYTAGHPQLDISWNYDESKKTASVKIIQQQHSLFTFPLVLRIDGSGDDGMTMKSILVKDKETDFTLPMSGLPRRVIADPNTDLLFEGNVKEGN